MIATNVGAIPEIVLAPPNVLEAARTGWLAEPDDPVSFARAIAAALATEAWAYNAIGTRARHLASQFFTPARTAAAALGLYASLFEGRGSMTDCACARSGLSNRRGLSSDHGAGRFGVKAVARMNMRPIE